MFHHISVELLTALFRSVSRYNGKLLPQYNNAAIVGQATPVKRYRELMKRAAAIVTSSFQTKSCPSKPRSSTAKITKWFFGVLKQLIPAVCLSWGRCILPTVTCCICHKEESPLIFIDCGIETDQYQHLNNVLKKHLVPWIQSHFFGRSFVSQQALHRLIKRKQYNTGAAKICRTLSWRRNGSLIASIETTGLFCSGYL